MMKSLFNNNRALIVALALALLSVGAARGGSLAGGENAPPSTRTDEPRALSAKVDGLTRGIFANIQAGWSRLAATERDGGHLMVLALNEVRKCRRELQRQQSAHDTPDDHLMLADGAEEDIEGAKQVSANEEAQIETSYEKFGEMARASVVGVDERPGTHVDREEHKKVAMAAIKRRTIELVKSVFMEELAELAQALLVVWAGAGHMSAQTNVNMFGRLLVNLKSKLLKYLVGIFVDFIPFIVGQKHGEVDLSFDRQMLRDDLSDFFDDDDDEHSPAATTENPGAALLSLNWID